MSDGKISIDFLLPNGMFIPKTVDFDMPLDMLKQVRPELKNVCLLFPTIKLFYPLLYKLCMASEWDFFHFMSAYLKKYILHYCSFVK